MKAFFYNLILFFSILKDSYHFFRNEWKYQKELDQDIDRLNVAEFMKKYGFDYVSSPDAPSDLQSNSITK
jgi:hypothetical protein